MEERTGRGLRGTGTIFRDRIRMRARCRRAWSELAEICAAERLNAVFLFVVIVKLVKLLTKLLYLLC